MSTLTNAAAASKVHHHSRQPKSRNTQDEQPNQPAVDPKSLASVLFCCKTLVFLLRIPR
ncbi:putative Ubiquitin-protein ligase BRE1A [Corchorus olitorius]|uniref:Ubiquitin-protein ligase BRE1A n=1 Tax=Corchorus olitorius TaxID=93759 RepID=A0A1R3J2U8_9ROSI|nr:putative Ubiquitin-protein ligase BRE1A [Corchorus olitorius]